MLYNLIGNAIKFTFKGYIEVRIYLKDGYLFSEVRDTGIGIKESEMGKLFKFFGKLATTNSIN